MKEKETRIESLYFPASDMAAEASDKYSHLLLQAGNNFGVRSCLFPLGARGKTCPLACFFISESSALFFASYFLDKTSMTSLTRR